MDWGTFLRREWGAVLFVLTVIIGLAVVPLALYFNGQKPAQAVSLATPVPASTPRVASGAATVSPSPSHSP